MTPLVAILLDLLPAVVGADPADGNMPTAAQIEFFESKVRPLLVENCFKCHSGKEPKGGLLLTSRATILAGGETGPAIVPGSPQQSLLIEAVNYASLEMPPDGKLNSTQIATLSAWVRMGAPWPNDGSGTAAAARRPSAEITPEDRAFWSFQTVRRPGVPELSGTADAQRVENPIDAFILQRLHAAGLTLSPPASRRELIRRAYFDLIGLPPAPQDVAAFEADNSPTAYERLLDRLLASPQYGERWGRHWLDQVRYAQTNGYERDDEKPFAWRYRDYVIAAFNQDKPYDRFVMEQLAGDELPDVSPDSIIATGFYRLGVWDDEPDDKQAARFDELDDIVRTTGEAFLGLTIGCARCHDHKFDPVPQDDYYRMLAFFRHVVPYGTDKSDTHWNADQDGIFTPLVTPEAFREWEARTHELKTQLATAKSELEALSDSEENKPRREELKKKIDGLDASLSKPPFPQALSVRERQARENTTHVLVRGNYKLKGKAVEPGTPQVLNDVAPAVFTSETPVAAPSEYRELLAACGVRPTSGRRLALAEWIASPENPLTARVLVNRLWHYHFGRGIVATPSDFGRTGSRPTHPELLDWLAAEFVSSGWQIKRMHKLIMLSATYRQSSRATNEQATRLDPGNTLCWRQNLRRLEAEAIRDAILCVSGQLNWEMGGRGIFPELPPEVLATQSRPGSGWDLKNSESERSRRTVYVFLKRTLGVPMLEIFDLPVPDKPAPTRMTTTIAPQALILLNNKFTDEQALALALRVRREAGEEPAAQVAHSFQLALGRTPTAEELQTALEFLARHQSAAQAHASGPATAAVPVDSSPAPMPLVAWCKLVFNLNEFVYID
jgi:hypothetical protein